MPLRETGYQYCQFILTPTQLGIPNSRPRYFLIASRRQNLPYQAIPSVPALPAAFPRDPSEASDFFQTIDPSTIYTTLPESSPLLLKEIPCRSVSEYLELEIPDIVSDSSLFDLDSSFPRLPISSLSLSSENHRVGASIS
jgi:site-specific DNA-cytosine methylase